MLSDASKLRGKAYLYTVCAMLYRTYRLRQDGWLLPRFRAAMLKPVIGQLDVRYVDDEVTGRPVLCARIIDPATCAPFAQWLPLLGVTIQFASSDHMILAGTERVVNDITGNHVEYAQSWMLEAPPGPGHKI